MQLSWHPSFTVPTRIRRPKEPATAPALRLSLLALDMPDAEAARLGRERRVAAVEAEQMRAFLRAGGAAAVRR